MKRLSIASAALAVMTTLATAGGTHSSGHGDDSIAVGKPGTASEVSRIIEVSMKETDDGEMIFEPKQLDIKKGETIRFVVKNEGEQEHEFVLDTFENVQEHKALMEKFPEMEHDDPNAIRLDEGNQGEIIWTFSKAGKFEFACLIPGHYESGMKGDLTVAGK